MNIIENSTQNSTTRRIMEILHKERKGNLNKRKYVEQLKVDAIITMQENKLINLPF